MKFSAITLLSAAGLTLVVGCSNSHDTSNSSKEPTVHSTPRVETQSSFVSRPLDKFAPTNAQDGRLKQAEAAITNGCLRKLGYSQHPLSEKPAPDQSSNIYEFYWFPDAARTGYSTPPQVPQGTSWDESVPSIQQGLLDGKTRSYKGNPVPKDGCYGEAGRRLTKNATPPDKFSEGGITISRVADASPRGLIESYISVIRQKLSFDIKQDSRVKKLMSQWSQCMSAEGYNYPSPAGAAGDNRWGNNGSKHPSKDEISAATTDMACKKKLRYLDVVIAVESAYETRYIEQHPGRVQEFIQLRTAWDKNAQRLTR
ncbi:hypothetical protein OIE43_16895 [Streptomyces pseudovenezuelae]|uniref:hypothetical protein n=1 Tax=Streptomyces pseudovenezuelae TaxID=67350 RepID=UPI002E32DA26|nr:hypothetical protein [Streptomyces pseudovenezuelae]